MSVPVLVKTHTRPSDPSGVTVMAARAPPGVKFTLDPSFGV